MRRYRAWAKPREPQPYAITLLNWAAVIFAVLIVGLWIYSTPRRDPYRTLDHSEVTR